MLTAPRCLKSNIYPILTCRVKGFFSWLSRYYRVMQTGAFRYSSICILNDSLTFLSDPKLPKFRYLRNFDNRGYVSLSYLLLYCGLRQGIHIGTYNKKIMSLLGMSLFNISKGYQIDTPITSSSVFVDICKTSENGFTRYSVF